MISRRCDASAVIEPGRTLGLVGGGCVQLVTVLLSDPEPDAEELVVSYEPPVAATLSPREARTLAFCLLELADNAEQLTHQR
jgi:hypothetical protein